MLPRAPNRSRCSALLRVLLALAVYAAAVLPHATAALALGGHAGMMLHGASGQGIGHPAEAAPFQEAHSVDGATIGLGEEAPAWPDAPHPMPCCGLWCAGMVLVPPALSRAAPLSIGRTPAATPRFVSRTAAPDPPPPRLS